MDEDHSRRMTEINTIPPVSLVWKFLGWSIPVVIISSIALIGWTKGSTVAGENITYWILANGIPSSLGALIAFGHPLTILAAFLGAPITSLTPIIGAGYVCAFVQVMKRPPVVMEFEQVLGDMATVKGWWKNKLLRVLLCFMLPGFGSLIGTWIGGFEILKNLIN
jgi:pheromone shutdown protein TraB